MATWNVERLKTDIRLPGILECRTKRFGFVSPSLGLPSSLKKDIDAEAEEENDDGIPALGSVPLEDSIEEPLAAKPIEESMAAGKAVPSFLRTPRAKKARTLKDALKEIVSIIHHWIPGGAWYCPECGTRNMLTAC